MCSDVVIRVKNISKCYHIYDKPRDRLMQMLSRGRKKYFREFWALKDVSFEVKKGETFGVIGRNGSGKSTLLQIICGTLTPSSGVVEINGRVAALLELGSGFNPEFTGRENVYLNGAVLGLSRQEIDERLDDIISFADIGDFVDQPVKTYSSGMMVRLAFSVIAHVDADVLIIDEALAVGDAFFVQKCMRYLRKFMEHGSVLFVSHDTGTVVNLCNQAIWLNNGELNAEGLPKDITEKYLEEYYQSNNVQVEYDSKGTDETRTSGSGSVDVIGSDEAARDMRLDFINCTKYRNDIELLAFDENANGFGTMGAEIQSVKLLDSNRHPLQWVVGGENVVLKIDGKANSDITNVIFGFFVKDRLGQDLFGDNTYITYKNNPMSVKSGESISASFAFRMPILPVGDYSITAAIAEGTQDEHIQHHWMHDALIFKSHSSSVCAGLVGVPMTSIDISSAEINYT